MVEITQIIRLKILNNNNLLVADKLQLNIYNK